MSIFLVTYDLNKETKRPDILSEVRKYEYQKLSESSYAIKTTKTVHAVFAGFKKFLDSNDVLYIINLTKPFTYRGYPKVNEWLELNLPG